MRHPVHSPTIAAVRPQRFCRGTAAMPHDREGPVLSVFGLSLDARLPHVFLTRFHSSSARSILSATSS